MEFRVLRSRLDLTRFIEVNCFTLSGVSIPESYPCYAYAEFGGDETHTIKYLYKRDLISMIALLDSNHREKTMDVRQ